MDADKHLNVSLRPIDVQLETVEIEGGKKDPAYGIMKQVIANKKVHLKQFDNYTCETYMKVSLERDTLAKVQKNDEISITFTFGKKKNKGKDSLALDSLALDSINLDSIDLDSVVLDSLALDSLETVAMDSMAIDSMRMDTSQRKVPKVKRAKKHVVLVESQSSTYFAAPSRFKTIVKAYRNIAARGEEGAQNYGEAWGFEERANYRTQSTNPYIFYQDVSDADFNFYQNLIQAPKLGDRPFVSLLSIVRVGKSFTNFI